MQRAAEQGIVRRPAGIAASLRISNRARFRADRRWAIREAEIGTNKDDNHAERSAQLPNDVRTWLPALSSEGDEKGRTKAEVDAIVCWLTGYTEQTLLEHIEQHTDFEPFFGQAP